MLVRRVHRHLEWIDLAPPAAEDTRALMKEFDLHPLIADEMLAPSLRQKTERYGEFLYLVLRLPSFGKEREHTEKEIDFVVGRGTLITAHYEEVAALHSFELVFDTNTLLDQNSFGNNGGHLLYLIIQRLYRGLYEEMEYLREELQRIEERIFLGKEEEMVFEISRVSRLILDFRRTLAPHKEILSSLEVAEERLFGQEFSFYARLLQSEYLKVGNSLMELHDSAQELRETNNSLLSTKQNAVMKRLTALAFIFLPLSFIASIFGMNITNTPLSNNPSAFWIVAAGMGIIALICVIYFKREHWL